MPIKVACRCGQSFVAKDELAGRAVKCPKCGQGLVVPPQAAAATPTGSIADLLDEAGVTSHSGPRCPRCENPLAPNAVLCTKCGLNLQTGSALNSSVRTKAAGHGEAAESILERAKAEIAKAPPPKDESAGGVIFNYIMAAALLLIAVVTIGLAYLGFTRIESSGNSQFYAGIVMTALGWLMYTSAHITLIVLNFKDGPVHGILSLVIPFYAMVYGALRNHGFWALLWNLGLLFGCLGIFMIIWFKDAKPSDVRAPSRTESPWVLLAADGFSTDGFSTDGFSTDGFSADGFSADGFSADWFSTDGLTTESQRAQRGHLLLCRPVGHPSSFRSPCLCVSVVNPSVPYLTSLART